MPAVRLRQLSTGVGCFVDACSPAPAIVHGSGLFCGCLLFGPGNCPREWAVLWMPAVRLRQLSTVVGCFVDACCPAPAIVHGSGLFCGCLLSGSGNCPREWAVLWMPVVRFRQLSTVVGYFVDACRPAPAIVHGNGLFCGCLQSGSGNCPREWAILWMSAVRFRQLSTVVGCFVDACSPAPAIVHAGRVFCGCALPGGGICPHWEGILWMRTALGWHLSTLGGYFVDAHCPGVAFVHTGRVFCGCALPGGGICPRWEGVLWMRTALRWQFCRYEHFY